MNLSHPRGLTKNDTNQEHGKYPQQRRMVYLYQGRKGEDDQEYWERQYYEMRNIDNDYSFPAEISLQKDTTAGYCCDLGRVSRSNSDGSIWLYLQRIIQ